MILGRHLLVDLRACDPATLADPEGVESALLRAAERAGATILGSHFHRFEPQGVSGVVLIAESHLSVHTWPEHGYAAADIFTCGEQMRPELAIRVLGDAFRCREPIVVEIPRGSR